MELAIYYLVRLEQPFATSLGQRGPLDPWPCWVMVRLLFAHCEPPLSRPLLEDAAQFCSQKRRGQNYGQLSPKRGELLLQRYFPFIGKSLGLRWRENWPYNNKFLLSISFLHFAGVTYWLPPPLFLPLSHSLLLTGFLREKRTPR